MGGLEPPTSASQTRRAGRLRYTPADKSIIRSMLKRQDAAPNHSISVLWIILSILLTLSLPACAPLTKTAESAPTPTPSITSTQIDPTRTASITPDSVTQISTETTIPTAACLETKGEVVSQSFYSERLSNDIHFYIYLPPCYHTLTDQRYPSIYLLHGLARNNDQWLRLGLVEAMDALIANDESLPFIAVLPLETDFAPPQTSLYPDAIVYDLIPWVDEHYRTLSEKRYRGIGGVSRGAAWAVRMGFKYHEVFSKVGAHSLPLFEADGANILTWITQTPPEDLPVFFIDIGRDDPEWKTAQDFADLLNAYNLPHEWYLFEFGHTEEYWSNHLEHYLRWYGNNW